MKKKGNLPLPWSTRICIVLSAFLLGVGLESIWQWPLLTCVLCASVAVFLFLFVRNFMPTLLVCISSGVLLVAVFFHTTATQPLFTLPAAPVIVTLHGWVCDAPDQRLDHTKLTICVTTYQDQILDGKILIRTSKFQDISYGDQFELSGKLEVPFEENGFSYRLYLLKDGITHTMANPRLTLLKAGNPWHPLALLYTLRFQFEQQLNSLWHEPHASFLAGLLIGSRKGIPQDVLDNFQVTGLTHIIAISGYNITLLIVIITTLFGKLSRRKQLWSSIAVIVAFTIFVGGSSAVIRASIMGILGLLALLLHRKTMVIVSLLITASLMIVWKPLTLIYDVGFQLSFLAIIGLLYIAPYLEQWTSKVPDILGLKEALLLTISATITTTPLILYHFGMFSFVSPIANVAVAPFLPLAMLFGFFAVVIHLLFPLFALPWITLTSWCLEAVVQCARFFAALPFRGLENIYITPWALLLSYLALVMILLPRQYRCAAVELLQKYHPGHLVRKSQRRKRKLLCK